MTYQNLVDGICANSYCRKKVGSLYKGYCASCALVVHKDDFEHMATIEIVERDINKKIQLCSRCQKLNNHLSKSK